MKLEDCPFAKIFVVVLQLQKGTRQVGWGPVLATGSSTRNHSSHCCFYFRHVTHQVCEGTNVLSDTEVKERKEKYCISSDLRWHGL